MKVESKSKQAPSQLCAAFVRQPSGKYTHLLTDLAARVTNTFAISRAIRYNLPIVVFPHCLEPFRKLSRSPVDLATSNPTERFFHQNLSDLVNRTMVVQRFTFFQIPKSEDVQEMVQQYRKLNDTAVRVRCFSDSIAEVQA